MPFRDSDRKQRVRFTQKELPEIKNWDVGQKYIIQLEVRLKSKGENEWEETGEMGGSFVVDGVKAIEEDKIKKLKEKYR